MRNFLILIVSLLAPYALYASGCNQNPQAAFPMTPEMRALARAPEGGSRAPYIPAPAIDREILASAHDAATKSRVQAALDRSNVYAMAAPAAGLFVLPTEQTGPGAPSMAAAPMPSAREFWSRPVAAAAPQSRPPQAQPRYATAPDVYAMAPSGQPFPEAVPVLPALGFEPLPEPITIGPAIPTAGFQFPQQQSRQFQQIPQQFPEPRPPQFAPPAALPPAGAAVPPGPVLPYSLRPGEKLLPPETVPGLFLGADAAGAATARQPLAAAGTVRNNVTPDGHSAPPPLLSLAPPGLPPPSSRAQSSAPQHRASRRLEALLNNTDAAVALAPLPSVAGKANFSGETVAAIRPAPAAPVFPAAKVPAMSAAPVQPLPLALPPAGLIPPPPAAEKQPAPVASPEALHDFFRTDFWAAKQSPVPVAPTAPAVPVAPVTPIAPAATAAPVVPTPALPPFPLAEPVKPSTQAAAAASRPTDNGLKPPEDFARDWDLALPPAKAESRSDEAPAPKRVTLKPVRRKQDFQAIDAGVDVAPMNF